MIKKILLSFTLVLTIGWSITNTEQLGVERIGKTYEENLSHEMSYQEDSILALNYHRVRERHPITETLHGLSHCKELETYSVYADEFESQMRWLKEQEAYFLTLDEVIQAIETDHIPDRAVWVNFDDMDQTIYENAHPILEELGIPATGFIITGQVGNPNFNNIHLMDLDQLKDLDQSGLWTFASHTNNLHYIDGENHSVLLKVPKQTLEKDINDSQTYLTTHLENCRVDALAYPYGQVNDRTVEVLNNQGIELGFTLEEQAISSSSNDYFIPRILVNRESFESLIMTWEAFH